MKFALTIIAILFSRLGFAEIEYCSSENKQVQAVAHRGIGYNWTYTFQGKAFHIDSTDAFSKSLKELPVQPLCETITKIKCENGKLIERVSVRQVQIVDNQQVVFNGNLTCASTEVLHGLLIAPQPFDPCVVPEEILYKKVCINLN